MPELLLKAAEAATVVVVDRVVYSPTCMSKPGDKARNQCSDLIIYCEVLSWKQEFWDSIVKHSSFYNNKRRSSATGICGRCKYSRLVFVVRHECRNQLTDIDEIEHDVETFKHFDPFIKVNVTNI
jgi:hypothetical protein